MKNVNMKRKRFTQDFAAPDAHMRTSFIYRADKAAEYMINLNKLLLLIISKKLNKQAVAGKVRPDLPERN